MNIESKTTEEILNPPDELLDAYDVLEIEKNLGFYGPAEYVISNILSNYKGKTLGNRLKLLAYTDRLARLALLYKNSQPVTKESLDFYLVLINFCRQFYNKVRNNILLSDEDVLYVKELGKNEELMKIKLEYPKDRLTTNGMIDSQMENSVESILEYAEGKTLLLIPVANGAMLSSFELYANIQDKIKPNSLILPIKYSRLKNKDTKPLLSDLEIDLIRHYIEELDAIPVIWDDDIISEISIIEFYRYLEQATDHDEFRILAGLHQRYELEKHDRMLNTEMIAKSTFDPKNKPKPNE